MHASNSYQALSRILSFYPEEVRPSLLGDLSSGLAAIISQRLLRTVDGKRLPACEILLNSKLISELVEEGNFMGVKDAMSKSMTEGSQTFEEDIARLIIEGKVSWRTKLKRKAESANKELQKEKKSMNEEKAAKKSKTK